VQRSKKRTITGVIVISVLVISAILYLLADRYLIDHVEIADVNSSVSPAIEESASDSLPQSESEAAPISLPSTDTSTTVPSSQENTASTDAVFADDWNYRSAAVSISISEVTKGSGNNKVTYFVADVVISDDTQLKSAFAEDSFGLNIIAYTSEIAQENDAIFAINGDYYGFRRDGIEIRNGVIYRDVPARTGLAYYKDGTMKIYDETQTSSQELLEEGVWNTLSFGPALIEDSVVVSNLDRVEIDTNFGNHPIQGNQPRTGIGIIDTNHFVFVVVDGRNAGYSRGITLTEFAQIFQDLGCTDAYNIDGGGSSTMYFRGRVVNNPLGRNHERGTSDILYVGS
jgi:exopolysaccharide biosynthesis protein